MYSQASISAVQSAENRRKRVTILVTLTSRSDSDVGSSNVSLKENKPDAVNPNSSDIDYHVRKNEGKILWFSVDCVRKVSVFTRSHRS